MNIKKIGKIQIWIGCILLLVTIVSSILIIKNMYIGGLIGGVETITKTWGEVVRETNSTIIGIEGHVVSTLITESMIFRTTIFIFGACALILIVLSIILITQGLVNINRK